MFITIIIFIIILGLLVLVHEFGHFIVAKKSGMRVLEFGFGFPPRLFGLKKSDGKWKIVWGHRSSSQENNLAPTLSSKGEGAQNETIYSINLIPLGGFVKIWGENNEHGEDPRSFINRPFWARFFTLVAGVVMNVILAWVLFSVGFIVGLPTALENPESLPKNAKFTQPQVAITEVLEGKPAEKAGIKPGDIILKIDNQIFTSSDNLRQYIRENAGKEFNFEIKRLKSIEIIKVPSIPNPKPEEGPTGIALANIGKLSFPFFQAFWEGGRTTFISLNNIALGIYQLFTSKVSLDSLGGPVKIAQLTGQVADMGIVYLIQFTAFLSLNLAILNILPFPALDGGRVLFLLIEKIRGKKNNQKVEQWANLTGFALLIFLMILVTIKDVKGFF